MLFYILHVSILLFSKILKYFFCQIHIEVLRKLYYIIKWNKFIQMLKQKYIKPIYLNKFKHMVSKFIKFLKVYLSIFSFKNMVFQVRVSFWIVFFHFTVYQCKGRRLASHQIRWSVSLGYIFASLSLTTLYSSS